MKKLLLILLLAASVCADFSTDKPEGDSVTVQCEYFQSYTLAGVYRIEEQGGYLIFKMKDGSELKLIKNNTIGYEVINGPE